jgi:ABC-type polysaccharide/polyol phosphate transport system ATPase subunit
LPILEFDQVSKKFLLNRSKPRSFLEAITSLGKRHMNGAGADSPEFWVLRDLSVSVHPGEAVGIIGDNGAGKSTILKLAAKIIAPTQGHVVLDGRVGALLEVGVGFHPDLTGRENIYLSGAIIGLTHREMRARLDEIIAFSEIGDFIDVPVRHYSSGMMVRLGFSVATSIQPDVLLVDEVLAVGDWSFRYKCLERIEAMLKQGTAMLYVSHGLDEVRRLCNRALWLDHGVVKSEGEPDEVVRAYINASLEEHGTHVWELGDAQDRGRHMGSGEVEITGVAPLDGQGRPCDSFLNGSPFVVRIDYRCRQPVTHWAFGLSIYAEDNTWITSPNSVEQNCRLRFSESGSIYYVVDELPLKAGNYELTVTVFDPSAAMYKPYDHLHRKYHFTVVERARALPQDGWVELPHRWLDEQGWANTSASGA